MMKISATVITFNEEENIEAALASLAWADEIVVVDSESTDRTAEIARRYTPRVIVRPWPGYAAQKNFAAEQASHDWVFNLDADERVSPELAAAIAALKGRGAEAAGYEMARRTFYLGHWIRHSGWYPDYKLRLYDRRRARFAGDYVHESVRADGPTAKLAGDILHYTIRAAADHHRRLDRYTSLAAEEMAARGARPGLGALLFAPFAAFARSYLLRRGFLDGVPGLAIAWFAAYYVFLKNLKAWEARHRAGRHPPRP